jgi:putative endonuclease
LFTVYVLQNGQGRLYIGQTSSLIARLQQHQRDEAGWTRSRGPWNLVHHEDYATRSDAMRREKFLKSGHGRDWLRTRLNETRATCTDKAQ